MATRGEWIRARFLGRNDGYSRIRDDHGHVVRYLIMFSAPFRHASIAGFTGRFLQNERDGDLVELVGPWVFDMHCGRWDQEFKLFHQKGHEGLGR